VLPFGGHDITEAIAEALDVSYDEAQALKHDAQVLDFDEMDEDQHSARNESERVDEICTAKLNELCEYLKRTEEEVTGALVPRSCIYLSGGGIALLRGGIDYLKAFMERNVKTITFRELKVGGPEFASAVALIDMVFDAIESRPEKTGSFGDDDALPSKALAGLRGLFRKD